ncbi:prepilin-type N-terminal cleavage/methylation domain-containing protein [uncultured Maricaulis sp.]|uniref:type II secretion system protein n=1 Tax=uncultured Maricaulis sp. TaxID=174710 RepID=UPI0030DB48A0|tara:strand:- start:89758 stop:90150 length:393 start_codon:yes stop_codon:yes gene_type:complete
MSAHRTSGFTLLEALVALMIFALASVGVTVVLANALSQQAMLDQDASAWAVLVYHSEQGETASGRAKLDGGEVEASWRVRREPLYDGELAGVAVTWVSVSSEVVWIWKGRENRRTLGRVEIAPAQQGSHS